MIMIIKLHLLFLPLLREEEAVVVVVELELSRTLTFVPDAAETAFMMMSSEISLIEVASIVTWYGY